MSDTTSFVRVLEQVARGDQDSAAAAIWRRFAQALLVQAQSKINPGLRNRVSAEDIVQEVFLTFFKRVSQSKLEWPHSWGQLWGLLVTITIAKAMNQMSFHLRQRRDAGKDAELLPDLALIDHDLTPQEYALFEETKARALAELPEPSRQVVELTLQGLAVEEIAAAVGRSSRFVYRSLEVVREKLEAMARELA